MLIILLCTTGTGKRSNHWNVITIRMGKYMYYMQLDFEYFATFIALAVFSRIPAAYEALKSLIFNSYHLEQHCSHTLGLFCMNNVQATIAFLSRYQSTSNTVLKQR